MLSYKITQQLDGSKNGLLDGCTFAVSHIAITPDASHIAVEHSFGNTGVWNRQKDGSYTFQQLIEPFYTWGNGIDITPSGSHIVTRSNDHIARVWKLQSNGCYIQQKLGKVPERISYVAITPDGSCIVLASWDFLHVFTVQKDGSYISQLIGRESTFLNVKLSSDGSRIATINNFGAICVWTRQSDKSYIPQLLNGNTPTNNSIAMTPDGSCIVSGSWKNNITYIWRLQPDGSYTREQINDRIGFTLITPDKACIFIGNVTTSLILTLQNGSYVPQKLIGKYLWPALGDACITNDGQTIVTFDSRSGGAVIFSRQMNGEYVYQQPLWYTSNIEFASEEEEILEKHAGHVTSVAISPDGSHIVTGCENGDILIWTSTTKKRPTVEQALFTATV
jgi:WD40 repeat protein